MEIKASLKHLKIAPRKVRLVTDLIKGKTVELALDQLRSMPKRASRPVLKLLESAISNAKHNFHIDRNSLFVKNIKVDEGPSLKRWTPRARGSASPILKRSSHISLVLIEKNVKGQNVSEAKHLEEETTVTKAEHKKEKINKPEFKDRDMEERRPKQVIAKQKMFRRKAI